MKSVSHIRSKISNKSFNVSNTPGWYIWWFDENGMKEILQPVINELDTTKIARKKIDGKDYYALYFGISKDLKGRIIWHVSQHHTPSSVKSGFLSTLRQTLSALLGLPMTQSEKAVNDFMDKHCVLEYDYCKTIAEAKQKEKSALTEGYYPLNIQSNKGVPKQATSKLTQLRKKYRK